MATDKNFSIKNGLSVGNTEVIDGDRNLVNIDSLELEGNLPSDTSNKLYRQGSSLYWDGGVINTSGNSGVFLADGGDSSAPSYSFTNDTNTGMYADVADTLRFAVGGQARMSLTGAGLGVTGTVGASTGYKLLTTQWMDSSLNISNVGTISSGAITTSGTLTNFLGSGSGTFTRTVLHTDQTNGVLLQAPLATNVSSGTKKPITLTWRDGYSVGGGVKIEEGKTIVDSLHIKAGSSSTEVIDSSRNVFAQDISVGANGTITRSNHHSGHLEGSYNNVGVNSAKSNPIYTIGSNYNPSDAALGGMYGIGYTKKGNATFLSGFRQAGWGLYVASDGDARVWLNAQTGVVASTAGYDVGSVNVIDSSRNLTNIGTISSGAITSSGKLKINQAGSGTSNVPSAVAEFSGQSSGAVLKALSLVNSVTAASGNGTELAFHNASNYSPTGTVRVIQAGDAVTDSKMVFQIYRGGLRSAVTIDHDENMTVGGAAVFGNNTVDPDSYTGKAGGFGTIADGSGWSARGVFVHGGGTGDAAAMAYGGSRLYFGIQDGSTANSMATWLDVQTNKQTTFAAQINTASHGNSSQWNTAYGWGNHASAGYLTSSSSIAATQLTGTISNSRLSSDVLITDGGTYSKVFSADLNTITGFRIHRVTGFTGTDHRAFTSHHNLLQLPNTSSSGPYEAQLAFTTVGAGTPEFKFRSSATTWSDWVKVFNDGYHPNADTWTTARTLTVTLTGDVTGTANTSIDGSANKTITISTSGSFTETDTLATVTGRGATTNTNIGIGTTADSGKDLVVGEHFEIEQGHLYLNGTIRINENGNATLGTISSGAITTSGTLTNFLGSGSGTYTRTVLYTDQTNGVLLQAPLATNVISGTKKPITLTWRDGYSVGGGVKIEEGKTIVDSLHIKAGSSSTEVIDSSRNLTNIGNISSTGTVTTTGGLVSFDASGTLDGHRIGRFEIGYASSGNPYIKSAGTGPLRIDSDISAKGDIYATTSQSNTFDIYHSRTGAYDVRLGTADYREGIRIDGGSGNVGIGTASPEERLTVNGNTVSDEFWAPEASGTDVDGSHAIIRGGPPTGNGASGQVRLFPSPENIDAASSSSLIDYDRNVTKGLYLKYNETNWNAHPNLFGLSAYLGSDISNANKLGLGSQATVLTLDGGNAALEIIGIANTNHATQGQIMFYGSSYQNEYAKISAFTYGGEYTSGGLKFEVWDDGTQTELLRLRKDGVVVNEGGGDYNFRVESDGNANMLFVDAGNNRVGIGTASPSQELHVVGGALFSNSVTVGDSTSDALTTTGGLKVGLSGGTTVIDSSRNLTNIGTISSGAITSTGTSTFDGIIVEGDDDSYSSQWGTAPTAIIGGFSSGNHDGSNQLTDFRMAVISKDTNGGNTPVMQRNQAWVTGGISGEAYNSAARWDLGRWENSGVDARSRLDLYLADDSQTWDHVMTWRAEGSNAIRVGINTKTPTAMLDVNGAITSNSTVTWSGGSSTNANTAYTYSQVGHLPLAGGVLTGNVSSNSRITADLFTLTNDATNTSRHRVSVYDSGTTSYGMMLWNSNGTSGDWSTMIYGPNQANRRISFGKITGSTFNNHGDVTEVMRLDLDDNYLHIKDRLVHYGDDNTYLRFDTDRIRLVAGGTTKFDSNNTYLTSADLSGYLTAEADTLATVTGRGATTNTNIGIGTTADSGKDLVVGEHFEIEQGHLYLAGTVRINENGNATLGVINSGQITSSGSVTAGNASTSLGFYVGTTQVIEGSTRNLKNIGGISSSGSVDLQIGTSGGSDNVIVRQTGQSFTPNATNLTGLGVRNTGTSGSYSIFETQTGAGTAFQVRNNGDVRVLRSLMVNGTTAIDSSRNGDFASLTSEGVILSDAVETSNPTPSTNQLRVSGYGMIGNRGNVYITNSNSAGQVQIGIGGAHNANPRLVVTNTSTTVTGSFTASGNITAYSDERLKSDIKTLDGSKVYEMRGVSFKKDGEKGSGVIAQELEKVAPELVQEKEYKSVAYGNLVGYLIEAIKDQKDLIDAQQEQINQLTTMVNVLKEKL